MDAGIVLVERLLHQLLHVALGRSARAWVSTGWMLVRPMTSRIALSATALMVASGFWMLNRKSAASLDLPEDREIDVDDVLVAGQHQALSGMSRPAVPVSIVGELADGDAVHAGDASACRPLDRVGQAEIQAGRRVAVDIAEAKHDAELVWLDPEGEEIIGNDRCDDAPGCR